MKFKIDENLPAEFAEVLQSAGHDAMTVPEQRLNGQPDERIAEICLREARILVTLDLDFADIRTYPPREYPGFIVFRLAHQDKLSLLSALNRLIPIWAVETCDQRLWVVEENRMRVRE